MYEKDRELFELAESLQPSVSRAHQEKRIRALGNLQATLDAWATSFRTSHGLDYMTNANVFNLKVAGSFRFGVYTETSDIDVLMITCIYIDAEVFFSSVSSALAAGKGMDKVLNIPKTRIPIIELVIDGIPIDLLMASTSMALLPDPFNVLDASIMGSVDNKTLQSLNSARVTDYVLHHSASEGVFVPLLKLVRIWAKARGIFGAKYGYLGGVQWCLLVLHLLQNSSMDPERHHLSHMVRKFFKFLESAPWKSCIISLQPLDHDVETRNWYHDKRRYDEAMVLLTPTEPYTNTTFNVNSNSLLHLKEELTRASELCSRWKFDLLCQPWMAKVSPLFKKGWSHFLHGIYEWHPEFIQALEKIEDDEKRKSLDEEACREFNAEKGRIDSKMRMIGLAIKKHIGPVEECRLFVSCHEVDERCVEWIFGLRLTEEESKKSQLVLNVAPLLNDFRGEMKLHKLGYTYLHFKTLSRKAFRSWHKKNIVT